VRQSPKVTCRQYGHDLEHPSAGRGCWPMGFREFFLIVDLLLLDFSSVFLYIQNTKYMRIPQNILIP
jgi:hypothetical protein